MGRGKVTRAGDMYVIGIASEIEIMVKQHNTAEGEFMVRSGWVVLPGVLCRYVVVYNM